MAGRSIYEDSTRKRTCKGANFGALCVQYFIQGMWDYEPEWSSFPKVPSTAIGLCPYFSSHLVFLYDQCGTFGFSTSLLEVAAPESRG